MVDNLTPQPPAQSEGKRGINAYVSSSAGRVVVVAIALGVLLVVAGVAAVVVVNFRGAASSSATSTTTPPPVSQPASGTPSVVESATPADPVPDSAVFAFRDVFRKPVRKAESTGSAEQTETGGSNDTSPSVALDPDTLYLQDIVSVNDDTKAVLALGGALYTLGEGGRIPGTPWKVLDIRSTAVTMLYGDVQIVLSVGQGMEQK